MKDTLTYVDPIAIPTKYQNDFWYELIPVFNFIHTLQNCEI